MSRPPSMRWRFIVALAGVSLFALAVVGVVFYVFLGGYVLDRQKETLVDQAVEVAEQVESLSQPVAGEAGGMRVMRALLRADLRVLPAGSGIAVFRGEDLVARAGSIPAGEQQLERLRERAYEVGGTEPAGAVVRSALGDGDREVDALLAAAPIVLADGTTGLAVVTLSRADAFTYRAGIFRALLISAAIAILLAVLVGWGLGEWMSRPLRRLSAAARSIAAGARSQPLSGSYPGEVQELADSLESMRRDVRRSEDSLRGFVASAAHELRTPLTSIQGFSQALLDGTAATPEDQIRSAAAVYRESTRLRRLVDALLTLSRYDSREFEPVMGPVRVDLLVNEEVERLVQTGLSDPGRISVEVGPETPLVTDGDMLRQVIANLLRNAVQYGGSDPVTVRTRTEGRRFMLEVANGGEPLPDEERAQIFSRFYRGRAGRQAEGFGLGLALVWEICEVLGGWVELLEGGPPTRFRVTLPLDREVAGEALPD